MHSSVPFFWLRNEDIILLASLHPLLRPLLPKQNGHERIVAGVALRVEFGVIVAGLQIVEQLAEGVEKVEVKIWGVLSIKSPIWYECDLNSR